MERKYYKSAKENQALSRIAITHKTRCNFTLQAIFWIKNSAERIPGIWFLDLICILVHVI